MSTSGDVQYLGGYYEYIGGCSVHRGDIMRHAREQVGANLSISLENPNVLNVLPSTEHPPMYS